MSAIIETTVYSFSELDTDAKESARDWYRGCIELDEIANDGDGWDAIAALLGVSFDTHSVRLMGGGTRSENSIYWSLYPTKCAFDGSYIYAKGAPAAIRKHAPLDVELHRIADEMQRLQRTSFYRLSCRLSCHDASFMRVEQVGDNPAARTTDEDGIAEVLRDFARWIGSQIEAQADYLYSEEAVDESILANDYQFTADGRIA